jgi:membrane fusion protein, multidrug efflux system
MPDAPLVCMILAALAVAVPAGAEDALPVEIVTVAPMVSGYDYVLTGSAEATNLTPLSFRADGRVIEVLVDQGDLVAAGAVIARIDPTQQREGLRAAQAGLQAAEAGLLRAQQDFDRQKALLDRGTVTQAEFDASREGLVTATSSRDQAQAQVVRAERALEDTVLVAPADAIVTERLADPGQVVGAAQAIVTLADRVGRDAVFLAPDGAPVEAFLGAEINLRLIDHGDRMLKARLSEVAPVVASDSGSVRVKARIENPPDDLTLLGEPVEGSLTVPAEVAAVVPWTAMTVTGGRMAVWTVDPATMRVALAPVSVERFTTESLLVSDGLAPGALVVGEGSQMLFPGRLVRARAEGTP